MSTPLLPEDVPEVDADPLRFRGDATWIRHKACRMRIRALGLILTWPPVDLLKLGTVSPPHRLLPHSVQRRSLQQPSPNSTPPIVNPTLLDLAMPLPVSYPAAIKYIHAHISSPFHHHHHRRYF